MTEHFLPDDLFHEILDLLKSSNDELFFDEDHLCYLHSMTQRTLAESEIDLFIHCQALSDLVAVSYTHLISAASNLILCGGSGASTNLTPLSLAISPVSYTHLLHSQANELQG